MTALASTRWPLHPQPFLDECLSSWLQRLAAAYDRSPDDLYQIRVDYPLYQEG
jgi:hypothetical protein